MCEELETTTVGEGIEGQILEGNTIQDHSTVPTEVEETEDISKDNEMMAKIPKPEVTMQLRYWSLTFSSYFIFINSDSSHVPGLAPFWHFNYTSVIIYK